MSPQGVREHIFQSTLPHRERLAEHPFCAFAPRISIHAPAQGATKQICRDADCREISIHAPAQGATWDIAHFLDALKISIHAPAQGATKWSLLVGDDMPISIHAPAQGATILTRFIPLIFLFQSTLPHRERLV